jgi:hypothetical protein
MLPQRLYHYTDLAGLKGIIQSEALWATEISQLNDTTEISYSRELLCRIADRFHASSASEYALHLAKQAATGMATAPNNPRMFVASLTDDGDNLSQWRGYATQGHGLAIGFDRNVLETSALAQGYTMVPIIYDESEQEQHFAKALSEIVEIIDGWGADPRHAPSPIEQVLSLGLGLTLAAMFIKNPYFRDEREWRLVRLIMEGVWDENSHTRVRGGEVVQYEAIELANGNSGENRIVEIVAGPLLSIDEEYQVREILAKHGLKSVKFRRSSVPLRNA